MKFDSGIPNYLSRPTEPTPFREASKSTPDRTVNAMLPFTMAIGAGFVAFVAVGIIAIGLELPVKVPLVAAGILMLGTMIFGMWWLVKDELLWSVEKIIGWDMNKDGQVGKPAQVITLEITDDYDRPRAYHHLPITENQLQALVDGLMSGQPLSEGVWIGRGRPFTKAEFLSLRKYLLDAGIACWRDQRYPTQGVELTAYGKTVVRQLAAPDYARTRTYERGTNALLPGAGGGVGDDDETT